MKAFYVLYRRAGMLAALFGLRVFVYPASAQVNVLTYHNNNARTGENLSETILTPANVNSRMFGKVFAYSVDGYVYAQPLYVSGLNIPGQGTHNVVFVATQHNSVYAFDADSNAGANGGLLWQVSLGPSAATPNDDFGNRFGGYDDIVPEIGITSTPVIDLGSGRIYLDAFTHEGTNYFHKIHALDITTGAEAPFSPAVVSISIPGGGTGSTNGVLSFQAKQQIQRSALTLANGVLFAGFASYADTNPYHGWLLGFDPSTLQLLPNYVFCSTPNSTVAEFGENAGEGGIWMAGCGVSVDGDNNLLFATGDGSFNAFSGGTEYGNSFIKLSTAGGLSVTDYFTPYNQDYLAAHNLDLGSGGIMLLPDQPGPYPHLLIGAGKSGMVYLINRDTFTSDNKHFNSTGDVDMVVQTVSLQGGSFGAPAYFNGTIYYAGTKDVLTALTLSNGVLPSLPTSKGNRTFGFPGATPSVSANGASDGIIWALQKANPGVLVAYDATDLSREIYNSAQAGARDRLTEGVKFTVPTVANGKVYVGGKYALSVFGLLPTSGGSTTTPGTYSGLFYESGVVNFGTSGSFSVTVTKRGTFSARLQTGSRRASFSGALDSSGSATKTIPRSPLTVNLQVSEDTASGTVSDGTSTADLVAYRSTFNVRTNPAPFAGKYTVSLPGPGDGNTETPQGDGYGSVTVTPAGQVKFAGSLADGTKLTQSAIVSGDGQWPFYVSLYRGHGQVLGWLQFSSSPNDVGGSINWIKLSNAGGLIYPSGFDLNVSAEGSAYQAAARSRILNFSDGVVLLTGPNLNESIVNYVTVNDKNRVTNVSSNRLTLTINASSGLFRGSVVPPEGGRPISFTGAVSQEQNFGSGYFLRMNQSGRVFFGPQ